MSFFDNILKKMKMVPEEEDLDEYDEYEEDDTEPVVKAKEPPKRSVKRQKPVVEDDFSDDDDAEEQYYSNPGKPSRTESVRPAETYKERDNVRVLNTSRQGRNSSEVCMIMPRSFDDATTIADMLLNQKAVVLNMEGIDMAAAQRLIDFASGACYTVGGNLQKISKKIFMIVPQSTNLSGDFGELVGDMVDLNSLNSAK